MSNTIEQAISALLNVCDGAHSHDGAGFNAYDAGFARELAKNSEISQKQKFAAYKMLRKYKKQLTSHGIDYDAIPVPEKPKKPELLPLDDFLSSISFNRSKIVNSLSKKVYEAEIPDNFWQYWKKYKNEIKEKGYSVSRHTGDWKVVFWEDIDIETNEPAEKQKAHIKPKQVKLKKTKDLLLKYQIKHVQSIIASINNFNSALDSSDTGTGKTYASLAAAKELGLIPIVVTPKSVKHSYKKVMKEHFGMEGFVSNYEQFRIGNTEYLDRVERKGKKPHFQWKVTDRYIIIFDEVHRCKNYKTQNAAMLVAAAEQNKKVIAMSATIGHNPLNMYALGRVLKLFKDTKGFFQWIYKYGCYKGQWGGMEFNGDREHLRAINKLLYPKHGSRISIPDLGNLFPDNKTIVDAYDMNGNSKEIKKVYSQMKSELEKFYKSQKEVSIHHLAIMQKARQKAELLKVPTFIEMTQDAIDSGHSVAIFVNYNQTVEVLAKKLKTNCIVWGNNKKDERDQNIEKFQSDESRVIICNIAAGGVGISLHDINGKYSRMSIISPDWSAQNLLQALGRIHRAGAKSKAVQKVVFAAGTIEENICEVVSRKIDNIKLLNDGDMNLKSVLGF